MKWIPSNLVGYPLLGPREMLVPPSGDGLFYLSDI
jgi:hypothetical protein